MYHFYPSLFDAFTRWQTAQSITKERERRKLLDSLNRVPFSSESVDMGTAFNAVIDYYAHKRMPFTSAPYTLDVSRPDNVVSVRFPPTSLSPERRFYFDRDWCKYEAQEFIEFEPQVYVESVIDTAHGKVRLYGVADEVWGLDVVDIKTTSHYYPGKYFSGWQRHVYPWCLTETGHPIESFSYVAYEMSGGTPRAPIIRGIRHVESYPYDHADSTRLIRSQAEALINFIEENKELITNNKLNTQ